MIMAPCINESTNLNKLNPQPTKKSRVIYHLDSYSETELKELKHKFISYLDRLQSWVRQVESRQSELLQLQDVDLRKQGNPVDKASKKIIGQKRAVPVVSPDTETKRRRLMRKKTVELDSTETQKVETAMMSKCGVMFKGKRAQQKRRSKPWAEFTQTPAVVSSQRDPEKPLQKLPNAALPKKVCKQVTGKPVPMQKRTVPEAKENPRKRREMSVEERDQLGLVLQDLAEEHLYEILQIVAKRNPKLTTPDGDGEIELDVSALDSESMWDLNDFVRKLKPKQDNKVT